MQRRGIHFLTGALAVGLLVTSAAGCADLTGQEDSADAGQTTSPSAPYAAVLFGVLPKQDMIELNRTYQEMVAACMASQGFEYVTWNQLEEMAGAVPPAGTPPFESVEWARLYGYGMSTRRLLPPQLRGFRPDDDPNYAIAASLSGAEATAYRAALGNDPDNPPDDLDHAWDEDWPTEGCRGEAWAATFAVQPGRSDEGTALGRDLVDSLGAALDGPAIDVIEREWAACMKEAGHPDVETTGDPMRLLQQGWGGGTEIDPGDGLPVDTPEMREHQREEIAMAVADYTCRDQVDYRARINAIHRDAEQQWIDIHREQLDELMVAAGLDPSPSAWG